MADRTDWIILDDDNFEAEVQGLTGLVMVVFWSDQRGSCHIMAPVVERVASAFAGRVQVGRLDIDDHLTVPRRYGIHTVPTLVFFAQGQVIDQIHGMISTRELTAKLQVLLDSGVT